MTDDRDQSLIAGGGEMGERIRVFDWSRTPLGPRESWSPALRTTVGLLLANRFPMLLWWGPDYISIYNDAYAPILGHKHPRALGQPVSECWSEIWHILQPLIDTPFKGGPATWIEDLELHIRRLGFTEEGHFTVAYSPVPDSTAPHEIGGVLATVHEITQKVVGERRIVILRDLGAQAAESSAEETCRVAAQTLAGHGKDVPFALLYLVDPDGAHARLAGAAGIEPGAEASPLVAALDPLADTERGWPLAAAFHSQTMVTVTNLDARFGVVPADPWADPLHSAVVVPVRSSKADELAGLLVAGVSSRLTFDELYRGFYELLASQIATAIAKARAYEEERKRAEALAEIDRAKTAFFSNVSHEFRTPLTLMLGPLEELKGSLGDSDSAATSPQFQQLDLVHRNGLRLLKLVNTLLDFSRIEAGRVQAVYEPTDLAAHTAELASVFRSATEKAGLKLIVDCPRLSERAYVDCEMWEKIVLNLVSNAFKFTFEGEIEVRLRKTTSHFELAVRDTGTGISPDELPKLFERFHRVAGARGRTHEGSGIGLALVQELARLHGGSVFAESVYGKGSTFTVQIPVGHGHLPQQQIGAERTLASTALGARPFLEEALRWLPDAGRDEALVVGDVAPPEPARSADGERPRIVLADDNADMRDYVRRLLSSRYEVEAVADGAAALAAIERHAPDLVLSDIMMPRVDGLELLARLRSDPRTSTLPIILLSARAGEEARVEGLQTGADDYLIKPFTARELLARVTAHLQTARVRRKAGKAVEASEARLTARNARLSLLSEALEHLLSSQDPERLVRDLFPKVAAQLGVDTYFNYMVSGDGRLTMHSCAGVSDDIAREIRHLQFGQAICGTVAQTRKPIVANDILHSDYDKAALVRGFGIQTYACHPLMSGSRLLGTLSFASRTRTHFEHDELEFMRLISHYVALAMERVEGERTLRESEARFRHMADNAPVMVWVTDPAGSSSYLSRSWYEFTGQSPETALGSGWLDALHPDDRAMADNTFVGANSRQAGFRVEYRLRRKDGEYRWVLDSAAPRLGEDGEFLGYIGSVIDITERKRAEQTQQLLLNELNHRVKNTLASVQAIVQRTLRSTNDPADFANRFSGRIQSLARVHSLLTDTSWQGTGLRELILDQLLQGAVDETRVTAWGPAIRLGPQMALHLALMLHELGTNSVKYGALSAAGGWVTIKWSVRDTELQLRWVERGGPTVTAPMSRGFGTTLVEQSAKGEGGRAQMLCEAEGVTWEIALPLPAADPSDVSAGLGTPDLVALTAPSQDEAAARGPRAKLAGLRFLVIEDEPLIALDLAELLERAGADVAPPVGSENEALKVIEEADFDGALLDANLHGRPVNAIAAALTRRNIPFVFITGYGREGLPNGFKTAAVLTKPVSDQQLLEAVTALRPTASNVTQLKP
jgi:PAS domain S-box-containing protein